MAAGACEGGAGHSLAEIWVGQERFDRFEPGGWVVGGENQPGDVVVNDFLRATLVADQSRKSTRLRFHDDLAKRVGGGGEEEKLGRGVDVGQSFITERAEEVGGEAAEFSLHFVTIGTVAGEDEAGVAAVGAEDFEKLGEEREVFFDTDSAGVEEVEAFFDSE